MLEVRIFDQGGCLLCQLQDVSGEWTATDIKREVEKLANISRHEQRLCYESLELPEDACMQELCDASVVDFVLVRTQPGWAQWHCRLEQNGLDLREAPDWVRSDRRLVLHAALQNPYALVHVSAEISSDSDFLLDAIEKNRRILAYIVKEHAENRGLVFEALQLVRAYDINLSRKGARKFCDSYPELAGEAGDAPADEGGDFLDGDFVGMGTIGAGVSASAVAGAVAGASIVTGEGVVAIASAVAGVESSSVLGAVAAVGGGLVTAASLAGALALPIVGGYALNQLVPGIAASDVQISVSRHLGTCRARLADVVWMVEETWGHVRLYYFANQSDAHECTQTWSGARILYDFGGFLSRKRALQEIAWEGPAWPRSTIRKAAAMLNNFTQYPVGRDGFI